MPVIKNHYLSRPQDGGVRGVVGEGSFGCVIHPPLRVTNVEDEAHEGIFIDRDWKGEGFVSKVFFRFDHAEHEMNTNDDIDDIDADYKWHLPSFGPYVSERREDLSECGKSLEKYPAVIQYKNGGVSLSKVPDEQLSVKFLKGLRRLCVGLEDMAAKKYVHMDIKLDNIVYDCEVNQFNFIDFGLSVNAADIINSSGFMERGYFAHPSEYTYIGAMFQLRKPDIKLNEYAQDTERRLFKTEMGIYDRKCDEERLSEIFDDLDSVRVRDIEFRKRVMVPYRIDATKADRLRTAVSKIVEYGDVFGLGIVFAELYKRFYKRRVNIDAPFEENPLSIQERFERLIARMCARSLKNRISSFDLVAAFDDVFNAPFERKSESNPGAGMSSPAEEDIAKAPTTITSSSGWTPSSAIPEAFSYPVADWKVNVTITTRKFTRRASEAQIGNITRDVARRLGIDASIVKITVKNEATKKKSTSATRKASARGGKRPAKRSRRASSSRTKRS
jgi:serine/threonine protein kinase